MARIPNDHLIIGLICRHVTTDHIEECSIGGSGEGVCSSIIGGIWYLHVTYRDLRAWALRCQIVYFLGNIIV